MELFTELVPSFFRALGLLVILPWELRLFSATTRVILALLLALSVVRVGVPIDSPVAVTIVREFLIGGLIGLPFALLYEAGSFVGELFDLGRGQTIGAVHSPLTGTQPVSSGLASQFVLMMVLAGGGLPVLVESFSASFQLFPLGLPLTDLNELAGKVVVLIATFFNSAASATLPLFAIFLIVDLAVGVIGKVVPNCSFQSEAFFVKSALGLLLALVLSGEFSASALVRIIEPLQRFE
jgi:flagellar biosynthetic protein FliR